MYFDPSGHWKKGDEKLNEDAKAKVIALTNAYHYANTKEEKEKIHEQAETIRADNNNYGDKDSLIEINNESKFDNYMTKAIKDGKLSNAELDKAMSIIGAAVGSSTSTNEAYINLNIAVTNTTTYMGKSDINVSTTVTNYKVTNQITTEAKVDVTNHYSAYFFYSPDWYADSKDARYELMQYYGFDIDDIGIASVSNAQEFTEYWNSIGKAEYGPLVTHSDNVTSVIIDTHATNYKLNFDDDSMYITEISKLENKDINNLIILGCNAGHLDARNDNVAATFSQIVNGGKVLASDGTVGFGTCEYLWIFGNRLYTSETDKSFLRKCYFGERKNEGWFIYQYINNNVTTSESLGKELTLNEMFKKMK